MIVCDKCMTNPADLGTIYVEVADNRQGIDICRDCFRAMFSGIEVARKAFCAQVNFDKDDRGDIEDKLLAEKNSEMLKDAPTKPKRESTAFERQRSISDFHPREVVIGRMAWMAENLVLADDGKGICRDNPVNHAKRPRTRVSIARKRGTLTSSKRPPPNAAQTTTQEGPWQTLVLSSTTRQLPWSRVPTAT